MNLVFIKSFRKFSREFSVFLGLNVYLNGHSKSVYRKWWSFAKHYAAVFDSNITIVNLIVILSWWIWRSLDSYVSEFFVSVNFSFWNSLISLPCLLPFCKSCKRNNTNWLPLKMYTFKVLINLLHYCNIFLWRKRKLHLTYNGHSNCSVMRFSPDEVACFKEFWPLVYSVFVWDTRPNWKGSWKNVVISEMSVIMNMY